MASSIVSVSRTRAGRQIRNTDQAAHHIVHLACDNPDRVGLVFHLADLIVCKPRLSAIDRGPAGEPSLVIEAALHMADSRPIDRVPIHLRVVAVAERDPVAVVRKSIPALSIVVEG